MKRPKAKGVKVAKPKAHSDTALVRECVIYAQHIAAYHNGFKADPDGNNATAAPLGSRHETWAYAALAKIAATPATTAEGLPGQSSHLAHGAGRQQRLNRKTR
jgi:hypothetical protein